MIAAMILMMRTVDLVVDAGAAFPDHKWIWLDDLVTWFWWFVAGVLYLAVGQTIVDSD